MAWEKATARAISRPKFPDDITAYILMHVNNNLKELLKLDYIFKRFFKRPRRNIDTKWNLICWPRKHLQHYLWQATRLTPASVPQCSLFVRSDTMEPKNLRSYKSTPGDSNVSTTRPLAVLPLDMEKLGHHLKVCTWRSWLQPSFGCMPHQPLGNHRMCLFGPYHPSFQISLCIPATLQFSSQRTTGDKPRPKGYPRATS